MLGVESSFDDTSVAVVRRGMGGGTDVLADVRHTQHSAAHGRVDRR